jgi:hypothetical protein
MQDGTFSRKQKLQHRRSSGAAAFANRMQGGHVILLSKMNSRVLPIHPYVFAATVSAEPERQQQTLWLLVEKKALAGKGKINSEIQRETAAVLKPLVILHECERRRF